MRHTIVACLLFISAPVFAQEVKIVPMAPAKKIPYLAFRDSLSYRDIVTDALQKGRWKGSPIDSVNGFIIHQLPLDRMRCLVPGKDNPAIARAMAVPLRRPDAAPIPNAIRPDR